MTKRVYIDEAMFAQLGELYEGKEDALNKAVGAYLQLRQLTLRALMRRFTRSELIGMVDAFNGTFVAVPTIIPPAQMLQYEMEDAETLQQQSTRFGYIAGELGAKLAALSDIDAFFIIDEIVRFWHVPQAFGAPTPDLNRFLELYADSTSR